MGEKQYWFSSPSMPRAQSLLAQRQGCLQVVAGEPQMLPSECSGPGLAHPLAPLSFRILGSSVLQSPCMFTGTSSHYPVLCKHTTSSQLPNCNFGDQFQQRTPGPTVFRDGIGIRLERRQPF